MKKWFSLRLNKNEQGVALIEFAIAAPLLILLFMGIVEFGWLFNGWVTITGAAREGARIAVYIGEIDDKVVCEESIRSAVTNHATPTFSQDNVVTYINYPVLVKKNNNNSNPGQAKKADGVLVKATGKITPILGIFVSDDVVLTGEASMRVIID